MHPPVEPYDSGDLDVDDGQAAYWEVAGSPDGLPAVWLHGGPGAPASPGSHRRHGRAPAPVMRTPGAMPRPRQMFTGKMRGRPEQAAGTRE
jgi:hypothetical protein